MIQSQIYKECLSYENGIYDELFTDEFSTAIGLSTNI